MKGTKRLGVSESNSDANNSYFQSKRIMVGHQFEFQRAESSQQKSMDTPLLDMRRAESSRQHVRALNNQFASWIQTQLQNHPDELWEDGVRDYLNHASSIMEKFSDVVNWLKANSTKSESLLELGSHAGAQKKLINESKDSENKSFADKTANAQASATSLTFGNSVFATSWSPRPLFNNQESKESEIKSVPEKIGTAQSAGTSSIFGNSGVSTSWSPTPLFNVQAPFSFGVQSSNSVKPDTSSHAPNDDGDDDVEQPSSPSLKKTEDIGIMVVHEVKCKLYVKSTDPADKDPWKDRGTGQLSIKCNEGVSKGTKESRPTIIVRNEVGRLLLNALLYPGIKTSLQKNSIVAIFHTADESGGDGNKVVARTFLIRTKSEEDRNKLAAAIQEYAPAA